ncbi:MAG: 2-hydroxyglutaryl-CoA dehydratase, partial [Firmicutes bacterium]|nr:2-hydroxyglutaryl-CoA dehydratase [Bacillota bacterium]
MDKVIHLGIDVGSTTVKIVALNDQLKLVFSDYQRHYADIKETVISMMRAAYTRFPESKITIMFTGSGGIGIAESLAVGFTQEVIASTQAIERFYPQT